MLLMKQAELQEIKTKTRYRLGSQERRQAFIDFRLHWFGQISRADLSKQFKTSVQQASVDIKSYRDKYEENITYDISARRYVSTEGFEPKFKLSDPKTLFRHIRRLENPRLARSWIDEAFPSEVVPPYKARRYNSTVVKALVDACRNQKAVSLEYVSGSTGQKERRILSPHTMVGDSIRWHVRAFDHDKNRYSDYVISRMSSVRTLKKQIYTDSSGDEDWNTKIVLELKPKNGPDDWRQAIANEFGMKDGIFKVETRKALLFYVLRRYGFNPRLPDGLEKMRNESSQLLSIVDLNQVEIWLGRRKLA